MMKFTRMEGLRGTLLESPVWDDRRGVLFLCDIEAGRIHEVSLTRGPLRQWEMGDKVGSLGLCDSGRLVVALARSVILFDPDSGARRVLWDGYDELPTSRLNDGKVGPDGAFWVGGMDGRDPRQPIASLYRVTAQGAAVAIAGGIRVSNGLAWSPDGRAMYHSDSRGVWIDRHDFDPATGALGTRTRIATPTEAEGRPDGAACDAEGAYWAAGVSAGVLNRFAPDGALLARYPVPVPAPTMPCFCGPGLRQLALTSLRPGNDHPLSGSLFLADAPVAGAPVARMKGV